MDVMLKCNKIKKGLEFASQDNSFKLEATLLSVLLKELKLAGF